MIGLACENVNPCRLSRLAERLRDNPKTRNAVRPKLCTASFFSNTLLRSLIFQSILKQDDRSSFAFGAIWGRTSLRSSQISHRYLSLVPATFCSGSRKNTRDSVGSGTGKAVISTARCIPLPSAVQPRCCFSPPPQWHRQSHPPTVHKIYTPSRRPLDSSSMELRCQISPRYV